MKPRGFEELDPVDKKVLLRVDFNSPLDPVTGRLLDDRRIRNHIDTINRLRGAAMVLLTHQSRPGKKDFTDLEVHADRLQRILDREVTYIDDIFGSKARNAVKNAEKGDIVLLENVRFYSEEYMSMKPEEAANTHLIEKLSPLLDAYVNDAFSAAHRNQPSLIGFPSRLPSYAGLLMERELRTLGGMTDADTPRVFSLGGAKAGDAMKVIRNVLRNNQAEKILLSGVIGNIFLYAEGYDIGDETKEFIEQEGYTSLIDHAEEILDSHGDIIELPLDIAVEIQEERKEVSVDELPTEKQASDIGVETIAHYSAILGEAATTVVNGPPGIYEEDVFRRGTLEVFRAATKSDLSIACGGDTSAAINALGIKSFSHVSTGGGSSTALLSGDKLPAVEALEG